MLKTAFIGQENYFDHLICEWLSEHTDLSLIIWTNKLAWAHGSGSKRAKRVIRRFAKRARSKGPVRAVDEILYYLLYRTFLQKQEQRKLRRAVAALQCSPRRALSEIRQIRPENIRSDDLRKLVESLELDAMFAMCIDVYLPNELIHVPTHGTFLWHEGITPEYRGVYSPFWALLNRDYANLGYTLLKMTSKLDAGDIYVQGRVEGFDLDRDWHSYIGHKAILESLPRVAEFLTELESGHPGLIERKGAVDRYYSYPTASGLLRIELDRALRALGRETKARIRVERRDEARGSGGVPGTSPGPASDPSPPGG